MTDTIAVLRAARGKISKPGAWTQAFFARDKRRRPVSVVASNATCWCAAGAIMAVTKWDTVSLVAAVDALEHHTGRLLSNWNDTDDRTQEEVLAMFDRAIAAEVAKTEEADHG